MTGVIPPPLMVKYLETLKLGAHPGLNHCQWSEVNDHIISLQNSNPPTIIGGIHRKKGKIYIDKNPTYELI